MGHLAISLETAPTAMHLGDGTGSRQTPKGAGESSPPAPGSANTRSEVNVCMIRRIWNPLLVVGGPASHWIGPEMLVDLTIDSRNVNALADSGSQVNTITLALVQQYGFPVLPLEDLVDYPLNLTGLGRKCTSLLRFVILHMQVWGIAGYDGDAVFLVVPDELEFGWRVPLVIGTCTIDRIINVIWESEIDHLFMLWATARMAQLLSCQRSMAVPISGGAETWVKGASGGPPEGNVDKLVMVQESIHLGPFQTEIIEGQVKPPWRHISRDDHPIESGRPTTGKQTTSPWTPCPSCLYLPQERQQKGVPGGQKCV